MLDLHFSNRSEGLLGKLSADLATYRSRAAGGVWEPVHVVLPNPAVKQFVYRELARAFQVLAHVKDSYLEGFWRRFLPQGRDAIRLLDRSAMQGLVLALLQDPETLRLPELGPLVTYLEGPARELKAYQLSAELARLFEAYLLGRPEWAPAWERGAAAAAEAPAEMERWQRRLWTLLRAQLKASGQTWMTLPELSRDPRFAELPFPEEVFVFGLGHVARAHLEAFRRLGETRAVHFYALSPSLEAWDDFPAELERGQVGDDPFGLESRGGLALRRWGRPVREHVRLLCDGTGWQHTEAFQEPTEPTLLGALQRDILQAKGEVSELVALSADESLAVHACPSPRREAEVVAGLIWDRIQEGQGEVGFSNLAVLVPEALKADYLEPLRLAFAGTHEIPWALADEGPAVLRELAEAAQLLLKLGLGDLNRAEVLRVLGHPALRRAWPNLPMDRLAELCERCGIIARLDATETEGTSLEGGLWTWERGLRRAALGRFAGEAGRLPEGEGSLPGANLSPEEIDLLHLVMALLRDARSLAVRRQSPEDWAMDVSAFLQGYLAPEQGTSSEDLVRGLDALGGAVRRLESLAVAGLPSPELGLREVTAFLEEAFQRLLSEALGNLGKGVVVASHASVRGIPFDTIFMLGMGEGVFPARDTQSALDLRSHQRRAGDLSRSDLDRTLFLETLLSARKALRFTYVHRDPLSGEEREPSSLILDLRDVLRPALGQKGWEALHHQHPIYRHDLKGFPELGGRAELPPNHHPEARAEAEALWLGRALREAAGKTELPFELGRWGLSPAAEAALAARVKSLGPLGSAQREVQPELRIRVTDLRKWLECPLQGGATLRLGLRGASDRDPALVEEEPFEMEFLGKRALARATFWRAARSGDLEASLQEALRAAREAGEAPVGPLRDGEVAKVRELVEAWLGLAPTLGTAARVRFGPDRTGQADPLPVTPEEAVQFTVDLGHRQVTVWLEGTTEARVGGEALLLSESKALAEGKAPEVKDRKELLRPWLDQLMLAAAGLQEGPQPVRVLAVKQGAGKVRRVILPSVDQASARAQLTAWLQEALQDRRWATLPIEAVLNLHDKDSSPEALAEWLEEQEESSRASFSALYGPLPRAVYLQPEADWHALAEARYGSFLTWSTAWEDAQ